MKCPKCGTENPQGRVLCIRCGTRLRARVGPGATLATPDAGAGLMERLRADLRRLAVVLVIVIVVAAALGLILR
ncbi:MAG: hypothetical protein A2Z07_03350 [Armatimonadetes bacterium RBG_16_67_12]|nr:MAG: hypothetical protein A2Z07_03350 [Armatimonadetes bacterium RBG_16_67_12]